MSVFPQVLLHVDAWQASLGQTVTCIPVKITAKMEATALSVLETSQPAAAPLISWVTSASTVSVPTSKPMSKNKNVQTLLLAHVKCVCVWAGTCEGHCLNKGTCLQSENGGKLCRCLPQFTGSKCEIDKCHYCRDGECIPRNGFTSTGEFTCR